MMIWSPFDPKTLSIILIAIAFFCFLIGQSGLSAIAIIISALIWVNNDDDDFFDDDHLKSA